MFVTVCVCMRACVRARARACVCVVVEGIGANLCEGVGLRAAVLAGQQLHGIRAVEHVEDLPAAAGKVR